ncbi:hypothetical protein DY000_02040809 [Brassica cretica]|uniref:Uncharacterized protein n=1 Tax=Brassica cretica TaxID=69181 RepID=A0ABQ7B614_BRACR|nr:hypothetical protein DY000_02040809 [Brassica cretica]
MSGLTLIEPVRALWKADKLLWTSMIGFGSGRLFNGLESSFKVAYSQMDGPGNLRYGIFSAHMSWLAAWLAE